MAYERLFIKITTENLWLYVLRMLMDRSMYAYEIAKSVKKRFDFSTAIVTVYVVLYKMRHEGLIQIEREESIRGRPDRKYYKITKKGIETFQRGIKLLRKVQKNLS